MNIYFTKLAYVGSATRTFAKLPWIKSSGRQIVHLELLVGYREMLRRSLHEQCNDISNVIKVENLSEDTCRNVWSRN